MKNTFYREHILCCGCSLALSLWNLWCLRLIHCICFIRYTFTFNTLYMFYTRAVLFAGLHFLFGVCVCARVCVCVCIASAHTHAHAHTHIHKHIHKHIDIFVNAYICVRIYTNFIHLYVYVHINK